jgi:hypothetical protein
MNGRVRCQIRPHTALPGRCLVFRRLPEIRSPDCRCRDFARSSDVPAQKVMTRSYSACAVAASTGVPKPLFFPSKSLSVTPRARPQSPQTEIRTWRPWRNSASSFSAGTPTPWT